MRDDQARSVEGGRMEIMEVAGHAPVVLHVSGRVNGANAAELGSRLGALVESGRVAIVLDFSHLAHMTSAGFRSLLHVDRQASEVGGTLVLCGLQGLTRELFEIGGFLDMFTIAATREEAIRRATL
jgi:stage II sporulation protein AA (anti-sigma F factor antagonist)